MLLLELSSFSLTLLRKTSLLLFVCQQFFCETKIGNLHFFLSYNFSFFAALPTINFNNVINIENHLVSMKTNYYQIIKAPRIYLFILNFRGKTKFLFFFCRLFLFPWKPFPVSGKEFFPTRCSFFSFGTKASALSNWIKDIGRKKVLPTLKC